jgi:hypothetical protein
VQTYLDKVDVPLLASNGQASFTKNVTIPSGLSAGNYFIDVFIDYTNEEKRETNESNNVTSKAISIIRFTVTNVTVSVTPPSLNEGEIITKSVTITGTGSGTVNYRWEEKDPGSTTWNPLLNKTATMTNGSVSIPPMQLGAYGPAGIHYHRVVVTGPNSITSNEVPNNVIVKIVSVQETHPSLINGSILDLGINSSLTIDFTDDLEQTTINESSVKLYRADNLLVSYALTYENKITLLRDARIKITPTGNLEYGTLYILEIDQPLTDAFGHLIDGDGDGVAGGKYKIGIQTELDPDYKENLKGTIENETDSYLPKITITNVRNDVWALTHTLENKIIEIKNNDKPLIIQAGVNELSIVNNVTDGSLNYQVDGKIYHIVNLKLTTNAGNIQYWNIVTDDNGNVVTDVPTMYKVLLTYHTRNYRFDKDFLEANQDALNFVSVIQALSDTFILVRDGAVNVIFSLSANQFSAFVYGIVNKITTDLPSVFLSVFLHQYNAFLRNEFELSLAKANTQVYPMVNYNDASYYLYSDIILYSQNSLFMDLTENVWSDRGNLSNQFMEVMDGARSAIAERLLSLPKNKLTNLIQIMDYATTGGVLIKSLIDNVDHLHSFDLAIQNKRQTLLEILFSPYLVSDCLLATELWQGSVTSVTKYYDEKPTEKIKIYPNPVSDLLFLEYNYKDYIFINIFNSGGNKVISINANDQKQQIDFSGLEPGFYVLEFVKKSGITIRTKVVKYK